MKCDTCGKEGARLRRVARTYGKGKRLLVIENIPIVSCPNCGESFRNHRQSESEPDTESMKALSEPDPLDALMMQERAALVKNALQQKLQRRSGQPR